MEPALAIPGLLMIGGLSATCVILLLKLRQADSVPVRFGPPVGGQQERQLHYAKILENCEDVIWLADAETLRFTYVTPSVQAHHGWTQAETIGKRINELIPQSVADTVEQLLASHRSGTCDGLAESDTTRIELEMPRGGGTIIPIETSCQILRDANGKPSALLGISRNISDRRKREREFREAEERVRLALYCSGDAVWDANLQTREMSFIDGWENVLGFREGGENLTIEDYLVLVHPDDRNKFEEETRRHLDGETQSFHCELRLRAKDGGWRWVLSRGRLWSRSADQRPLRMIGTHTDITSRKVAEVTMSHANTRLHNQIDEIRSLQTKLAEQAVRDSMTGLYNRRYLDETLDREVARARREGHPLSVVMIDVDHFKKLNDSYGHQAGDEVLKSLAEMLRQNTRTEDVACRYGGEEFLVLLPGMPLENACERAEIWRMQFEQSTFAFGNFALKATASLGVSSYPQHGKTPDELTLAADTALYRAKRNGRNRAELYEDEPIIFVTATASGE
jgi:diguanylate cyclase (GGDEF)-like protein/PAS domain S-box-containing protein